MYLVRFSKQAGKDKKMLKGAGLEKKAKEADIGIAGGVNEGLIIKHGEILRKVPEDMLLEELRKEILAL